MNLNHSWVTGFLDGKGNFLVKRDSHNDCKILPEFVVSQQAKDVQTLNGLKAFFKCGVVRTNSDGSLCYRVSNLSHLMDKIIPFFEKHSLKTSKKIDFLRFRWVIRSMVLNKYHTSPEGLKKLIIVINKMDKAIR